MRSQWIVTHETEAVDTVVAVHMCSRELACATTASVELEYVHGNEYDRLADIDTSVDYSWRMLRKQSYAQ